MKIKNIKIGILGLGYVGLPIAIEFGKKYNVIGFDTNKERVKHLLKKYDKNGDYSKKDFDNSKYLNFSNYINDLNTCNVFIVCVPTPVTKFKKPNLRFVKLACHNLSLILKKNDTVIFESTVYPGMTEEFCIPILEKKSNLLLNKDFYCGYSPERINPNDKKHRLTNIVKITSGSNTNTSIFIDNLYKSIIKAGTFRAKSIKIAEAAKVIENTQRDLNIAFMNELSVIFNKLNIDTSEVLKAASTKWNFINFKPGLVGGHCIGVDPYYLSYRSKLAGYNPKIINAGRLVNDQFVNFITNKSIYETKKIFPKQKLNFLVLGLTFKENCFDFRNSKSIELVKKLIKEKFVVHCFDPHIDKSDYKNFKKLNFKYQPKNNFYHCIIISVSHKYFKLMGQNKISTFLNRNGIIFDIKNTLPKSINNVYL